MYNYFITYYINDVFDNCERISDMTLHAIDKKEMLLTVNNLRKELNAYDITFYRYDKNGEYTFHQFD